MSASQNSCLRLNLNINVATQALCFTSDLVFSDGVRSVVKFALCKIEEQSDDFSKQRRAGRGLDVEHRATLTWHHFSVILQFCTLNMQQKLKLNLTV